tara:strand:- start:305 stop:556 length:252 start_codon:yes stop_codon:yes gene_type:complete
MASAGDSTEHIDLQLVALIRELEGIEELDPNAVAFLSSKIQKIRKSVETQFQVKAMASTTEKKKLEKPSNLSLAEQKRKQYFF